MFKKNNKKRKKEETKEIVNEIEVLELEDEIKEVVVEAPTNSNKKNKVKKEKKKKTKKEKTPRVKKEKKERKKSNSKKTFTIAMILILIIGIISIIPIVFLLNNEEPKPKEKEKLELTEKEEAIEEYSFSFIGIGDALLHTGVWQDAATGRWGSDGYQIYDFNHMLTHLADVTKDYDLKFYNQETIIGGKNLGLSSYPCFNSPDEIGLNMMNIGFNLVNLATNHTMDKGIKGAIYSAYFWHAKENVLAVGSYRSLEERNNIEIREVNGISYALLSYTYGTNGIAVPAGYEYLVNVWPVDSNAKYNAYKAQVQRDVESVRDKADVVMVSMHWGTEYQLGATNAYQRDAAAFLSSLGVDVIIGTHPHVVQPIEFVNDTLVIYSLGNFVSGQTDLMKKIGGIAAFTVNKTVKGDEVDIEITDVKADLIYTYHRNFKNYSIIPFTRLNDSLLYNYRGIYEQYKRYLNPSGDSRIQVGFIN